MLVHAKVNRNLKAHVHRVGSWKCILWQHRRSLPICLPPFVQQKNHQALEVASIPLLTPLAQNWSKDPTGTSGSVENKFSRNNKRQKKERKNPLNRSSDAYINDAKTAKRPPQPQLRSKLRTYFTRPLRIDGNGYHNSQPRLACLIYTVCGSMAMGSWFLTGEARLEAVFSHGVEAR